MPLRLILCFFVFIIRPAPTFTLFPYTTLFRSRDNMRKQFAKDLVMQNEVDRKVYYGWGNKENLSIDRKSTRLNSSHVSISYAVFCLKKKKQQQHNKKQLASRHHYTTFISARYV